MIKNKIPMKKKTARFSPQVSVDQDITVCLVAGGAGFVGSSLCESLVGQNCFVYCLDNFSTGREKNIARILNHPQFSILRHDLNSREKLKVPKKLDYVFHVAGAEAYSNGLDVSLETLLVNSFGTKMLLELARENEAKFLLASSEQVYHGFVSEANLNQYFGRTRTMEAEGAFAEAKRFAEALTFEYLKKYDLNARIVRLDFLYGQRMNPESGTILAQLFLQAEKGRIQIPGNGLTRLYPTYISDAVYGLVKATFSHTSKGRVYTLVNPQMVTILNFAYLLRDQQTQKVEIEFVKGDDLYNFEFPQRSVLDSQEALGWYPQIGAKEGIKLTQDWLTAEKKLPEKGKEIREEIIDEEKEAPQPKKAKAPAGPELKTERDKPPAKPSFISSSLQEVPVKEKLPVLPQSKEGIPQQKLEPGISFNWLRWLILAFLSFLLVSLVLFLPVAGFGLTSYQGAASLKKAQASLGEKDIEAMARYSHQAQNYFNYADLLLKKFSWLTTKIGLREQTNFADEVLQSISHLASATDQLWLAFESGERLIAIFFDQEAGDLALELKSLQTSLDKAETELAFAEAGLNQILPFLEGRDFFKFKGELKKLAQDLPSWRAQLKKGKQMLVILPGLLRPYDKATFLVLLQNNQELRPTGGFIGSYALVTVEKGKILDFEVEDIYTADGQLKGYIQPPDAIKRYLGEEVWWFRDSNISPDFPTSAARAAWFLEKEMKREVTGVVAINLETVKNILTATGPVYLPDYKEEINANNIFERAEYHSEVNFFPGSTQKRDFLASLTQALFESIKQLETKQSLTLAQMLTKSLDEKAIMIWLPGEEEGRLLAQYGWDGSLRNPPSLLPEFGKVDLADYLMAVEANFGVNKANFFISRESNHEVTISKEGRLQEKHKLTLNNQSPSDAWPGGVYKNYFRIYVPADSQLGKVTISDGKGEEKILSKKDYEIRRELDRQVFGFLIEVPVKETRIVTIEYARAQNIDLDKLQATYLFYWQKQAGIGNNPMTLTINYPMFLKPLKMSQEASLTTQSLKFKTDSSKDRLFAVSFGH